MKSDRQKCALCGEPCSPWFPGDDLCDWCWAYIQRKEEEKLLDQLRLEEDREREEAEMLEQRRLEEDREKTNSEVNNNELLQ